ncbi:MAG: hypothetical protein LBC80_00225 [Treponema sp.]|jgi:hypothetical protein|nr:hypothetical protein [Treponema sp.]
MNIESVPYQAFPSVGYALNASSNGRMSLPVAPGMVIYSHFKHISGTPAPEGTQGVNISRLKILNTLIDQLEKTGSQAALDLDFGNLDGNDEQRINILIEQYQKQIKAAHSTGVYAPTAPASGLLFNITV